MSGIVVTQLHTSDVMSFFSTVADKIEEDTVYDPTTHPSILEIKNHVDVEKNFEFQHITSDKIQKNQTIVFQIPFQKF
jgi:hypothetical protein